MKNCGLKIWAHRGISGLYPENTMEAFMAAVKLPGLTGIEFDIQLSKDGELVVIHDETLERTTSGRGRVCDMTLLELKELKIRPSGQSKDCPGQIPTLREVLEALKDYCLRDGLLINIELKNSKIRYQGMEEKAYRLVEEMGLLENVVFSSFLHESMGLIRKIDRDRAGRGVKTGLLAPLEADCLANREKYEADALHPGMEGLFEKSEDIEGVKRLGIPVRMWNSCENLYGNVDKPGLGELDRFAKMGVTDVFTNRADIYLQEEI